jgi:hypothetical protein
MSDASKTLYSTRQRLTSTTLNRTGQFHNRQVQELMGALASADTALSGVLSGLTITIDASTRQFTVRPGVAALYDAAEVYPDSAYRWTALETSHIGEIAAGTGYDRWDVVEIQPATSPATSQIVDIFDPTIPPNGAFVPTSITQEEAASATIRIRVGADNTPNPPNFLAGEVGWIPLAYISVDASGSVFGSDNGIVQCRPILRPTGTAARHKVADGDTPHSTISDEVISGGGCDAGLFDIDVFPCSGLFRYGTVPFMARASFPISNALIWEDEFIPSADGAAYAYAAPPPYHAGYGPLASREFVIGGGVIGLFASVGDFATQNCIVVLSTREPALNTAVGPPAFLGSSSLYDWPFRTGTTPAQSLRIDWVYLGAFDWAINYDGAPGVTGPMNQLYKGGGRVIAQQRAPTTVLSDVGAGTYNLQVPNGTVIVSGGGNFPNTATYIEGYMYVNFSGVPLSSDFQVNIDDSQQGGRVFVGKADSATSRASATEDYSLFAENGEVLFGFINIPAEANNYGFVARNYIDEVLAKR